MPKGVIVLLVVVAVLFLIALAAGCGQGEGELDPRNAPGIIDSLGNLGGGRQLRIGEDGVTTSCGTGSSGEAIVVNGSCAISVPSRGTFSRPLAAGLTPQGGSISATYAPNEGEQQQGNAPGDAACLSLAVDRHGGNIAISCTGGGQCPVSLRKEGCLR